MIVNRIAFYFGGFLSWITFPIALITNLVFGCIIGCPLTLIIYLPLGLIFAVIEGLLLAISWLWERVPWPLQVPLAVLGVPLAAVGFAFVLMIPEPGEEEAHRSKILLCQTFPFEMDLLRYRRYQARPKRAPGAAPTPAEIEIEAAMKQWTALAARPNDDPEYIAANDRVDRAFVADSGLSMARYTRITELLYWLGERT